MKKNNDSHVFTYRISTEQALKNLIETRFIRLLNRSRLTLQDFITERIRTDNHQNLNPSTQLKLNDQIHYLHLRSDEQQFDEPIEVLFENEALLAVEKPDCLSVTPTTTHYFNSVVNRLKEESGNVHLSPLHRLDIETSGVLLFSKRSEDRGIYQNLFQNKQLKKIYNTVVFGQFPDSIQTIKGSMHRDLKSQIYSKYRLVEGDETETRIIDCNGAPDYSVLSIRPISGFTNQIRCHLSSVGHSIIGDKKYAADETIYLNWFATNEIDPSLILDKMVLHCSEIEFLDPIEKKLITITSKNKAFDQKLSKIEHHFTTQ